MKLIKRTAFVLCLALFLGGFFGCKKQEEQPINKEVEQIKSEIEEQKVDITGMDFEFTDRDKKESYDSSSVNIKFTNDGASISGNGASADGSKVTLTAETTYVVSGKTNNGILIVDVGDNDKIQIVFDGLEITNTKGPAFFIKNADKVVITLADGSKNTLTDGSDYSYTDGSTNVDAVLFSKADLSINGNGTLNVNGNYKHGIVSKDDLVITNGEYNVTSKGVGLNGKDCVKISSGTFNINAGSDGIKSDNEEDASRGYVFISGGKFNIESGNDGIQAQTVLKIEDGEFNVKCGGGSANSSVNNNGGYNDNWGYGGNDFGGRPGQYGPGYRTGNYTQTAYTQSQTSSAESAKGIKSGSDILISGGKFSIDSADDSVHSNGTVEIKGGTFNISSGDDGIHADTALSVDIASITINKSYEGLESSDILILGGKILVTASDDGLNAAGGNDSSSMNGRPGMGGFTNSTGRIAIAGGETVIEAVGDGIDSNGSVTVSGGVTIVYGPTNSGNGAFDYDGTASITGGTFIALGSSGMAQSFTEAQNQGAIATTVNNQNAGTTIAVCDADGNVVVSVTAKKTFSHMVMSCKGIQSRKTYSIVSGCTVNGADTNGYSENTTKSGGNVLAEIKMTSNLYGSSGGMGPGGMMPGGMNGQKPNGSGPQGQRPTR